MMFAPLASIALGAYLLLANPVSYEYSGQTEADGSAYLVVIAGEDLDDVRVTIRSEGRTVIEKSLGRLQAGKQSKIRWKQAGSEAHYEADITAGAITASFAFDVVKAAGDAGKVGQFKSRSDRDEIVERHQATFETSFDLTSYEFKIYDGDGDVIASDLVTSPVSAGQRFTVKWPAGHNVFMIHVRGEDRYGRFAEHKLVPWSVEIPHTEINFDSGRWDVKNTESPKLDEAVAVAFHELAALEKVNEAVGANITPRLYIVGYTDTVGNNAANQKLSQSRAKAIAEYFRDKGFWASIYYAGMGERGLRVETGDNVDEVRNRRALYLIGVQEPAGGGQIPSSWALLSGPRSKPLGFQLPPLPEQWANYRSKDAGGTKHEASASAEEELPIGETATPAPTASDDTQPEPSGLDELDYGGGPPKIEGEPGATGKGCSVAPTGGRHPALLGTFVLLALATAQRRRVRALA